ncbi:MAG: hypothetical protein IOC39_00880 [Burkholderia sp.]|jgi:hypothetical protein|uniref:hypothetical protein n=1 Tax=Burkholderia sp. TaxID=36773 RepID=UPI0025902955|nr:hypothetical protein [Burkholderia sp.]MCA3781403.1 hypothetical protein [Burkholderia sp.]MCA3790334.1 hypothetical protein [Burkholderia sp.]MCA3795495.1 hypothetical protein [Burkholderia sp.]MCA3802316.1 hypothetical protein [Burkholderia sp.]MCA3808417.1 hypothetical protein [Burkholderia sp.]
MKALRRRVERLQAHFSAWLQQEALANSERGHQLRLLFAHDTWADVTAMAALARYDTEELTADERKCRVAALLVQAYTRKLAAEAGQ